jgi:RND family efflux transporter MFP subunit
MHNKVKKLALIILSLVLISSFLTACSSSSSTTATTGVVTTVSQSSTVEASGNITAKQQTTLSWETSGIVGEVNTETNSSVNKGDVLMTLDPSTAPSDVIEAQETLVSAKADLESAQMSNTAKAQAEVALASAQSSYNSALGNYWNKSVTQGTEDQIAVATAKLQLQDNKIYELKKKVDALADLPDNDSSKALATQEYSQALIDRVSLKTNLNYLRATPDSLDVQTLQAALDLAKAKLEDAQRAYNAVKDGPSSDEISAAQAKVDAAQSTVNMLSISAPFDGEVVAIQTQVGDQVDSGTAAIILVNRSVLYVDIMVDETDISKVEIGDTATISYSAMPDKTSTGKVTFINPVGTSSSGVVNYTVRVTLDAADADILLGATATVDINTGAASESLAVPVEAVQSDDSGEYVMRVNTDGSTERVTVVSGTVSGTSVMVTSSDLSAGDVVQLTSSSSSSSSDSSQQQDAGSLLGGATGGGMSSGGNPPSGGGAPAGPGQ